MSVGWTVGGVDKCWDKKSWLGLTSLAYRLPHKCAEVRSSSEEGISVWMTVFTFSVTSLACI